MTENKENIFLTRNSPSLSKMYPDLKCNSEDENESHLFPIQKKNKQNWIQQESFSPIQVQFKEIEYKSKQKIVQMVQLHSPEFIRDLITEQIKNEKNYKINLNFMYRHKDLKATMRATLFDWMKEVCSAFTMKRETLYLACHYLDSYLDKSFDVKRTKLQLFGISCLFVSQKIEEISPQRVADFQQTTDNLYTSQQICETEIEIMLKLNFKLTPPTYIFWLNLYTKLWDEFADFNADLGLVQFRRNTQESYQSFSEICQILDCVLVDPNSLQYNKRLIVFSLMYLIVGKSLKCFNLDNIVYDMVQDSNFVTNMEINLNLLFLQFMEEKQIYFDEGQIISLQELPLYVQYTAQFFMLPISFDYPQQFQQNRDLITQTHYEDFLNFQTHNSNTLQVIEHLAKRGT